MKPQHLNKWPSWFIHRSFCFASNNESSHSDDNLKLTLQSVQSTLLMYLDNLSRDVLKDQTFISLTCASHIAYIDDPWFIQGTSPFQQTISVNPFSILTILVLQIIDQFSKCFVSTELSPSDDNVKLSLRHVQATLLTSMIHHDLFRDPLLLSRHFQSTFSLFSQLLTNIHTSMHWWEARTDLSVLPTEPHETNGFLSHLHGYMIKLARIQLISNL